MAYDKVASALQLDAERHRQRIASVGTQCRDDHQDDLVDEEQSSAASRFRKAHRRLALVQRLGSSGHVRNKHIKQFGKLYGKGIVRSQESEHFLGRMLNSAPLMSRATEVLEMFHSPLFGADADCNKSELFGLIAQSLHDTKKATIMASWLEHVKPLKDELSEVGVKYDSLKAQFKEARSTYLKEVSELRDTARVRGDPLSALDADIVWFYEPTQCLEHEERKFLLNVMREKFKMMVENNPKVVRTFDFGQMEKLMEQVDSHECKQLRESLKRKSAEISQLQQAISGDGLKQARVSSTGKSPVELHRENKHVIQALTLQVEELRIQKDKVSDKLQDSAKQIECLQTERDELAAELRSELVVKSMLQSECEQLRMKTDQLEEERTGLEQAVDKLSYNSHEQEDKIKSLECTLEQYSGRFHVLEEQTAQQQLDTMIQKDETFNVQLPFAANDGAAEQHAAASCSFQQESNHIANLEEQCTKLQELIRMHLTEESRMETEVALEEAEYLTRVAGSLGCMDSGIKDVELPEGVRVCKCSNLLMDDSKFCRKCGQEWKSPTQQTRHQVIAALCVQLGNVATNLEDAIKNLNEQLAHKQDPSRVHSIAEAERKVTQLRREQKAFETRLIVERSAQSFEEMKPLLELETCNCTCFQELEVMMGMMKQLQVLCAEMTLKVRESANDNMQLNSALDSTLAALGTAKKLINRSKSMEEPVQDEDLIKGVHALVEAEHHCVFHRLFNPNSETKEKWKQRKDKLLEASFDALRPSLVMDTDPKHNPSFAAARPQLHRRKRPSVLADQSTMQCNKATTSENTCLGLSMACQDAIAKQGIADAERISEQTATFVEGRSSMESELGQFIAWQTESTQASDERPSMEIDLGDFSVKAATTGIKPTIQSDRILSMENASGVVAMPSPKNHGLNSNAARRTMYRRGVSKGQTKPAHLASLTLSNQTASHTDDRLSMQSCNSDFSIEGNPTSPKTRRPSLCVSKEEAIDSIKATATPRRGSITLPIRKNHYKSDPGKPNPKLSSPSTRAHDHSAFHSHEGTSVDREAEGLTVAGCGAKASASDTSTHTGTLSLTNSKPSSGNMATCREEVAPRRASIGNSATCREEVSPRRNSISLPICGRASQIVSTHELPSSLNEQPAANSEEMPGAEVGLEDLFVEGCCANQRPQDSLHSDGCNSSRDTSMSPRMTKNRTDMASESHESSSSGRPQRTPRARLGKQESEDFAVVSTASGLTEFQVLTCADGAEKISGHRSAPSTSPTGGSGNRRRNSNSGNKTRLPPMAPEVKPRMLVTSSGSQSQVPAGSGANALVLLRNAEKAEI